MLLWWEIIKIVLFILLVKTYSAIQYVWWFLNGTNAAIRKSKQPANYHISTHVLTIRLRYRFDKILSKPSKNDFIMTHHGFVHPEDVLKDNITLYMLSTFEAMFIELPPHINIFDSNFASFVKEGQFNSGTRIYIMPIKSFYKLADEVGRPQSPLIFLGHTSRCGSTLLSQLIDNTGEVVAMSEPPAFGAIARACQDQVLSEKDLGRHIVCGISMLCKPTTRKTSSYCIKINPTAMTQMNKVRLVFPDAKILFMYRDGLDVAVSIASVSYKLPILRLMFILSKMHKVTTKGMAFYEYVTGHTGKDFDFKFKHDVLFSFRMWAILCRKYLDLYRQNCSIAAVKYEDLINDPEYTLQQIFKYCDIPLSCVGKALRGLNWDSQRHSVLSQSNKVKNSPKGIVLPMHLLPDAQGICDLYGLPRVPGSCILEGTISHKWSDI